MQRNEATIEATTLVDDEFTGFGVPLKLQSDLGQNFECKVFQKVCEMLGIPKEATIEEVTTEATTLINDEFTEFGVPLQLHSDLGQNFKSKVFQKVRKCWESTKLEWWKDSTELWKNTPRT